MSLSNHPQVKKMRRTMIEKLGSREAYLKHMREIAAQGGSVKVPKGFAIRRKDNE